MSAHADFGLRPTGYRLPDDARIGRVRLQISHLDRSLGYYRSVLGLELLHSDRGTALLGARDTADVLIELVEQQGARPVPRQGRLGLFHFAILLPDREALGQFIAHLVALRLPFGSADHLVSEAVYLSDPDGLGIEVYADRPRSSWLADGAELLMATEPLDLRNLMTAASGAPWTGMPPRTTMGHVHLSVGDLQQARDFYHQRVGFDLNVWSYPGALFLSAGGYHHHLGLNTWSATATPATEDDARLIEWELLLPSSRDPEVVLRDPWGIALRLRVPTSSF